MLTFTKETRYSYYPTYRVVIPTGGEATLALTSATHISFDANHHCINGSPGDRCWIVCRGIEYGAHLHFHRVNGEWISSGGDYVSRVSTLKQASPSAKKWIAATMLEIVKEFTSNYPEAFQQADREDLQRKIEAKQAELEQAAKQAAEAENAILALTEELKSLQASV